MQLDVFLSLPSWSVKYYGEVLDDARCTTDGIWYFRDIITLQILRFPDQERVVKICLNGSPTHIQRTIRFSNA